MWSAALEAILTTLRYLAPATLLTLFWGQQSFLFKLLKHIDSSFRAIVFSSEEQKQAVLKWIAEAGPVRVEHLDTVWRHGWILCGVLDAALPGTCAGHPPTRLSLKHAQAIADHYLGVEPVFSRQELESNDSLSRHQEWKLATYLDRIREALSKITPPVSKPSSQRTPETTQVTLDYVARGSGLTAAQINNKMYFKIYPTAQQSLDPGEITILIRGPKNSYGMTVVQPIPGKAQIIRQKLLGLQCKANYTENVLPITQGATYLRTFGKNDMNKTYYIPKTKYDTEIDVEVRSDHARIGYTVRIEGKYEISITSRGQSIVGSPFKMTASKNIIDILERESFCLEDGEEIDIVDVKTDRKVVLRIVDFVTEKMLLKENGCLEKISDNAAKILMTTDNMENELSKIDSQSCKVSSTTSEEYQSISEKFKITVDKIIKMNRICKVFNNLTTIKKLEVAPKQKSYIQPRRQKDIPDIVNSTLSEVNIKPYILPEKRDKYIIPENISVSLRIEKPISSYEEITEYPVIVDVDNTNKHIKSTISEHLEEVSPIIELDEDVKITSSNNPFYNEFFEENNRIEKVLGTFVNTEYETNNSQNEEIQDMPIKILIEKESTPSPMGSNPFTNIDYVNVERPKTPVLKILTDEVKNREDSVYLDSKSGLVPEETLSNEFINPFFMHQQMQPNPIADFIIGAPVSLPPILRAPSPDPEMESIMITTKNLYSLEMNKKEHKKGKRTNEMPRFDYSTPLHKNVSKTKENSKLDKSRPSSTSHSLESNYTDELNLSTSSDNNLESFDKIETLQSDRNITPRKDTWDSAYVSIDDNASTPDNNNNENNVQAEVSSRQNMSHNDSNNGLNTEELSNMGPAEREIWQTCSELNNTPKHSEDMKLHKLDVKRPIFTPIIEETDRSLSSVMKETKGPEVIQKYEIDSVTEAFAELNDLYQGYFPNAENSSTILISDDDNTNKLQNIEIENIKMKNGRVDSASEDLSDMKRRAIKLKGTISEVQPNVTESISVSRTLHDDKEHLIDTCDVDNKLEIQFGDEINIVLERKKYWDERIRQIQAKSEETRLQHKKRRTTYKHMKANDSLTKRKGKQIVKHFLGVGEHQQATQNITINNENVKHTDTSPQISVEEVDGDVKLVEKWKKYWDDKLETERDETDAMCLKSNKNITRHKEFLTPSGVTYSMENLTERSKNTNDTKCKSQPLPVKQDLPEEVFKAFETSPKRFFGTSRKQILNKIDAFLGKPNTVDKSSSIDTSNLSHDTGLVSSRISLFHNISQTEELPRNRRKTRSLHNIYQKENHKESINIQHDRINRPTEINVSDTSQSRNINETGEIETEIKTKKSIIEDVSERQTESILLKDKGARMTKDKNKKILDDTACHILEIQPSPIKQNLYVKKAKHEYNKQSQHHEKYKKTLNKTSISKSEMDIFNKTTSDENQLDKYKSCDELPKINVKSFISLYENASKSVTDLKPIRNVSRTNSISSQRSLLSISSSLGAETHHEASQHSTPSKQSNSSISINNQPKSDSPQPPPRKKRWLKKRSESKSTKSTDTEASLDFSEIEIISQQDSGKETTYLSLSDIELEIIENTPQKSLESTPERNVVSADIDYKTRFKRAKEYFQSLEELRDVKKPKKLNECEMLLYNKSTESLENDRPQKRVKKKIKSHTMPSSEISKIWNQLNENQKNESVEHKYVKISEKFNVEDLFSDVMEGRLSRQGSLRGIPHKKAVLETFKSMENMSDGKLSPYEIAATQLSDFAKENEIKTAQTYLSEYPYLPTTAPSKYHSRLDVKASGLISLKELLSEKRRRNSVPDLRLNTKFTADL